jgi:hypothetical protein
MEPEACAIGDADLVARKLAEQERASGVAWAVDDDALA